MPAPESPITDAEWHLLESLWRLQRATARQVTENLHDAQAWAYSTVKTMLDRMAAKGLIHARQVGATWEFSPALRPDDARRSAWKRFVTSAFGGSVAPALTFIASEARLTKKQREALLSLLEEQEKS
ncbi:MAG: BlaI/MecI/CopY family transcriptional regulator [Phycisphaerae bacterium]|nr:BlaI/MecI/CopY family transcriptional regulator [Phycisphaerae bacterium]